MVNSISSGIEMYSSDEKVLQWGFPYIENCRWQIPDKNASLESFFKTIKNNIVFLVQKDELENLNSLNAFIFSRLNTFKPSFVVNAVGKIEQSETDGISLWSSFKHWLFSPRMFLLMLPGSMNKFADWFIKLEDSITSKEDDYWNALMECCTQLEQQKRM